MSRWTDLSNPSPTDDYVSPASDVLLGELQELPSGFYTTWRPSDFTGWPIVSAAEDVEAPKESDPLEPAPFSPDVRNLGQSQMFFVVLSLHEKPDYFFIRFGGRTVTSPYTLVQGRIEPSRRHTRFSPDFSNIKKFVAHVISYPLASPPKKELPFRIKQAIPTTVAPQVIAESEEKNLTKDLETAVKIAEESYSTLKSIDINIEHDPEILDRKTIRFTLTVSGEVDAILEDEALFKRHLRSDIDTRARELITVTYNREK